MARPRDALQSASCDKPLLGNFQIVHKLLADFAAKFLNLKTTSKEFVGQIQRDAFRLAWTFLGHDKSYAYTGWFQAGHIDMHVAHWYGVISVKPDERIAGALFSLYTSFKKLAGQAHAEDMDEAAMKTQSLEILDRATPTFLGLPRA